MTYYEQHQTRAEAATVLRVRIALFAWITLASASAMFQFVRIECLVGAFILGGTHVLAVQRCMWLTTGEAFAIAERAKHPRWTFLIAASYCLLLWSLLP